MYVGAEVIGCELLFLVQQSFTDLMQTIFKQVTWKTLLLLHNCTQIVIR